MREFVHLAASRNFTKTAEELYIAQSALSRHMASLENELNAKLINRDRNFFELTPAGEIVLEEFEKLLSNYENMLGRIAMQDGVDSGELRLGYLYYDMDYYVAKIRDVFRKKYPGIKLSLYGYQPAQLEEDLLAGKIDAALQYGVAESADSRIDYLSFLKIPYLLIYDKSHRFSALKDISISDLDGEKLICPEFPLEFNHVNYKMEQMLQKGGARISQKIPVNNYDEVPWILRETGGIYIAPMVNTCIYGTNCEFRLLLPDFYTTDVSAVWLKNQPNPAIKNLCTAIKICYS